MERFAIKIDKKLKANLYKICRLCGIDNPDMVPIISDQPTDKEENACIDVEAEMEMQQKINLLLGLTITKDDRMPQTMCCLCVDKINDFYEFREMCYATNAQTRKLLGLKNVKKPALDIKPKVEVKEESIVPTPISAQTPATNKNGNRKRKCDELPLKEETPETPVVLPKKKLRFSIPTEQTVKDEVLVQTKKKLRFSAMNEEAITPVAASSKKSKNNTIEDSKLKKEPSPVVPVPIPAPAPTPPPAVSNKKLRLAAPPQKELAIKKSKQKGSKNLEQKEADVKDEKIKDEIKEEPAALAAPIPLAKVPGVKVLPAKVLPGAKVPPVKIPPVKVQPVPKLKFGCNICKERFPAKVNLEAHSRTTHIPKIERYVCTACNEVLTKSFDIKNHQLWHKLSKTPYVCGCCGESILNTYAFSRHLREHAFEIPPALQVLDRECPQCHTSYATNFLYNIHVCAVKTKRCAGCNRSQRNDAEYLKHSAQCAKVYLNYSKHIMPSVEALEDAVRIKNENDVEAAAEEMARISGVSLDMAPVVHLTRLTSPLIMAASQCVSTAGLDDAATTSNKKSGKKGASKKHFKRVDELLKSTLDALVSIKHEPEVHVDQETPCAAEHSDNDDHREADDHVASLDDFHHEDYSDNESEEANMSINIDTVENSAATESGTEQIKIKQEIDETNEENLSKIGGGLKLKIKKEHGQLNSSIIEQQKSSEKRAEKRKKKKKHKEKEKDKQKLPKDAQDEQPAQDIDESNVVTTAIRIKAEPQDSIEASEKSVSSVLQTRPQPEAMIMTSIPMMQFQIACVSSGVEFNNGTNTAAEGHQAVPSEHHDAEPEDVKPDRQELDRMLKISHVSGGIAMETDETEENEAQQTENDGNSDKGNSVYNDEDDYQEESNEDDHHDEENESESELLDEEHIDPGNKIEDNEYKSSEDTGTDNIKIKFKRAKKPLLLPKPKLISKSKDKPMTTATKSRNKACKSTAKPPSMPALQISAVQSGVALEPTAPSTSDFTPIFIKPEPQNRGYSDEQPDMVTSPSSPQLEKTEAQKEDEELFASHTAEERNYISSIDFNNITIKQEKDIEINDVQITQKYVKSFANFNGIKRKRKQPSRSNFVKNKLLEEDERGDNIDENMDEEQETHDEDDQENYGEESEEEEEEEEGDEEFDEEEEEDEDMDAEVEDEEREYRELEYPPELVKEATDVETEEDNKSNEKNKSLDVDHDSITEEINESPKDLEYPSELVGKATEVEKEEDSKTNNEHFDGNDDSRVKGNEALKESDGNVSFVIANVCSQATTASAIKNCSNINDSNVDHKHHHDTSTSVSVSNIPDWNLEPHSEQKSNTTVALSAAIEEKKTEVLSCTTSKEIYNISSVSSGDSSHNSSVAMINSSTEISNIGPQVDSQTTVTSNIGQQIDLQTIPSSENPAKNTSGSLAMATQELQTNTPASDTSLKLGQPFEVTSEGQTEILALSQPPSLLDSTLHSSQETQKRTHSQVQIVVEIPEETYVKLPKTETETVPSAENMPKETQPAEQQNPDRIIALSQQSFKLDPQENVQNILRYSVLDPEIDKNNKLDTKYEQQQNVQINVEESEVEQSCSQALLDTIPNIQNIEVQPPVSNVLQPGLEISSVRTTSVNISPGLNIYPLSDNDGNQTAKANEEEAKIEGIVLQANDVNLEARPVTGNLEDDSVNNDDNEEDFDEAEEENDLEEEINNDDESTLGNNLEERQNYQNQKVLSQIRPAALALHPYLEDISSSSNSLLSNSLSQTPPPPHLAASSTSVDEFNTQRQVQQRLLNSEETENILNESNDVLSHRSLEEAVTSAAFIGQSQAQPNIGRQLPPHMPTFNFDNINEIAENNNNANIEREQLQDERQQQQHHNNQQQNTNNP